MRGGDSCQSSAVRCLIDALLGDAPSKGAGPQREKSPPGTGSVPPGSNRSSSGGHEAAAGNGYGDGVSILREPDAADPQVRFDERDVETEHGLARAAPAAERAGNR